MTTINIVPESIFLTIIVNKNYIDDLIRINTTYCPPVEGVDIRQAGYNKIPVIFNYVHTSFNCSSNSITSLEGSPSTCTTFSCNDNQLDTLEGGPTSVQYNFYCQRNKLRSLKGGPTSITSVDGSNVANVHKGSFSAASNTSLVEPTIYNCSNNYLTNLKYSPRVVKNFRCDENNIDTFEGCPEIALSFNIEYNNITSLADIHKHLKYCKVLWLEGNSIIEGGIGLLLIDGLEKVEGYFNYDRFGEALDIIKRHLPKHRAGLLACQQDLIDAGLEEYAKLA